MHTNQNAAVHRHVHISPVINLVSHNDLTKIVNTITYCDRAKPQKNACQLHFKKTKLTLKRKKSSNTAGGGTMWIKRSLSGHCGLLGLGIRYSVSSTHTQTHLSMTVISSTPPFFIFLYIFLAGPCAEPRSHPCFFFLLFFFCHYSSTSALASAAGQLEELVFSARPCIFKTTCQTQSRRQRQLLSCARLMLHGHE